jgi:hypothetical protein
MVATFDLRHLASAAARLGRGQPPLPGDELTEPDQ